MNQTKDPMIQARYSAVGKNSKGGDRVTLYIGGHKTHGNQELENLINALTEAVNNPEGAQIDIHVSDKEYQGRTFKSGILYVKPAQPSRARSAQGSGTTAAAPTGTNRLTQFKRKYNG